MPHPFKPCLGTQSDDTEITTGHTDIRLRDASGPKTHTNDGQELEEDQKRSQRRPVRAVPVTQGILGIQEGLAKVIRRENIRALQPSRIEE